MLMVELVLWPSVHNDGARSAFCLHVQQPLAQALHMYMGAKAYALTLGNMGMPGDPSIAPRVGLLPGGQGSWRLAWS